MSTLATGAAGTRTTRVQRARESTRRRVLSMGVLALDVAATTSAAAGLHGGARLGLGLAFAAVVPGWSVVGHLRLRDTALSVALTLAVSLASLMVVAQLLVTLRWWHLEALQLLIGLTCVAPLVWLCRRQPRPGGQE